MTPLQRTVKLLRERGYAEVHKVEYWNPHVPRPDGGKGVRVDLAGIGDVLAWGGPGVVPVMVQSTSGSNALARLKKIGGSPALSKALLAWLRDGMNYEIHGWRKLKGRWAPRLILATAPCGSLTWEEVR